jgi:hypothetical protein
MMTKDKDTKTKKISKKNTKGKKSSKEIINKGKDIIKNTYAKENIGMTGRNPIIRPTYVGVLRSGEKMNVRPTYADVLRSSKCTYVGPNRTRGKVSHEQICS